MNEFIYTSDGYFFIIQPLPAIVSSTPFWYIKIYEPTPPDCTPYTL